MKPHAPCSRCPHWKTLSAMALTSKGDTVFVSHKIITATVGFTPQEVHTLLIWLMFKSRKGSRQRNWFKICWNIFVLLHCWFKHYNCCYVWMWIWSISEQCLLRLLSKVAVGPLLHGQALHFRQLCMSLCVRQGLNSGTHLENVDGAAGLHFMLHLSSFRDTLNSVTHLLLIQS